MNKDFDLDKIEKRTPYVVPDGFFEELEKDILQEVSCAGKVFPASNRGHKLVLAMMSAAAILAVVVFLGVEKSGSLFSPSEDYANIEEVFNSLSQDDQDYMLGIYQEDVFMNE